MGLTAVLVHDYLLTYLHDYWCCPGCSYHFHTDRWGNEETVLVLHFSQGQAKRKSSLLYQSFLLWGRVTFGYSSNTWDHVCLCVCVQLPGTTAGMWGRVCWARGSYWRRLQWRYSSGSQWGLSTVCSLIYQVSMAVAKITGCKDSNRREKEKRVSFGSITKLPQQYGAP